ncbi:ArsR/SmtB family transcription factor [Actinacidiphila rubida]|uniref:ArsR/SmtB family transcription factor n=1 Tax=Actinacidiphila rubida TaxID=310780 RepID=UPI001FE52C47|nr:winged helix-turn-helix domain-containing protein [Actinacidiphila rubida]
MSRGVAVLRLHFNGEDASRIRFPRQPDPLWETVLSINLLGTTRGRAVYDPWRAQIRTRLRRLPRHQLRLLRWLAPPVGDFPDFLTPARAAFGLEEGIEEVLATPRARLRRELAVLTGMSSGARALMDGGSQALSELGEALRGYHRAALIPYWSRMQALVDSERAVRARAMLDHGCDGVLATLGPTMRWRPPVLEVDYHLERDIVLAGRGLVLVPSAFCWRRPVTLIDPTLPPVLVYPLPRTPAWWITPDSPPHTQTLGNLLGPTRAACLRVIEGGCTTVELARRTGVTPPTASQHATTLREAGLTTSTRLRNTILHTLTPLGKALLRMNSSP